MTFEPTKAAALAALERFLPNAGRRYQADRSHDHGPENRSNVSQLSPYLRCRIICETEVLEPVLAAHGRSGAFKFVQEVFWRTYWKGWLEQHPDVWNTFLDDLAALRAERSSASWRENLAAAAAGQTGIAPFDAWVGELRETGYLHNHARMWFASIWMHTLELPWTLGAAFFLEHLLDGDQASNTLSWRWVAGLQTRGKTYLARPGNIEHYTANRFENVADLAGLNRLADRAPLPEPDPPRTRVPLPQPTGVSSAALDPARTGLLLTGEDLCLETPVTWTSVAGLDPALGWTDLQSTRVLAFRRAAMGDALSRAGARSGAPALQLPGAEDVLRWARLQRLKTVLAAHVPVGPTADEVRSVARCLAAHDIDVHFFMRPHDALSWPHADGGFFKLGKRIPDILDHLELP